MRVNIFHYHLNPGGVTRIIESQIKALLELDIRIDIQLITGDCPNPEYYKKIGIQLVIDENLNYLDSKDPDLEPKFNLILESLRKHIQKEDILHFHNLNLGKNPLVSMAVSDLAYKGYKVLNHAHDFAEDRPLNYKFLNEVIVKTFKKNLKETLYPILPNYQYATINSWDKERLLREMHIPDKKISFFPNPVVFESHLQSVDTENLRSKIYKELQLSDKKKLITYPVRVIRRKNIGEFILLNTIFKDVAHWAVTQPPKNPIEIESYEAWKAFCQNQKIGILWEAGNKVDFEELIIASHFCISTSIQEGFGMVFMEPWLLNTPVIGRDIPMVTKDLKASGMEFPSLYNEIMVPHDNKDSAFSKLSMSEQQKLIAHCISDKKMQASIIDKNPFLLNLLNEPPASLIKRNKALILNEYSLEKYGERLNGTYQKLAGQLG